MPRIPARAKGWGGFPDDEKWRKFGDGVGGVGRRMLSTNLAVVKSRCLWSVQVEILNSGSVWGRD